MRRLPLGALLFGIALLVLTTLPYIVASKSETAERQFSGFVFGIEDGFSYLAKMRRGALGETTFRLFYTTEQHDPIALLYFPYLFPGRVTGQIVPPTSAAHTAALIAMFQLLRIVGSAAYLIVLYRFISAFIESSSGRFAAFVLATTGGGLGWLAVLSGTTDAVGGLPADFYIPEGFSFLILLGLPHLALARAMLLSGLLLSFQAVENGSWRSAVLAGLCFILVGLTVPFYLAVVYAVLGAWGLAWWLRTRAFPRALARYGGLAAVITAPLFLYYIVVFSRSPALALWSAQNDLPSPPPVNYLAAYSLLGGLALFSLREVWRRAASRVRFALLPAWWFIVPVLVYLPINVQRRMAEGVIVPLAVLAAMTLTRIQPPALRRAISGVVLGAASASSLLLLMGALSTARNPASLAFIDRANVRAFNWLNEHAPPDAVALGAFPTGTALPAFTHLRPFVGHGPETLAAVEKTRLVGAFFRDELSDEDRAALLAGTCIAPPPLPCSDPITYVLFGPSEQALAGAQEPGAWADGLTLIYAMDGYRIYAVSGGGG